MYEVLAMRQTSVIVYSSLSTVSFFLKEPSLHSSSFCILHQNLYVVKASKACGCDYAL